MQAPSFEDALDKILSKDPRYHRDLYQFIIEALEYTRKNVTKNSKRHVSGQELLEGIRQYGLERFGPMARTVFEAWGAHNCQDFGEAVFLLVEYQGLRANEKDSRADFANGYDFDEAFRKPFLPRAKLAADYPGAQPEKTSAAG